MGTLITVSYLNFFCKWQAKWSEIPMSKCSSCKDLLQQCKLTMLAIFSSHGTFPLPSPKSTSRTQPNASTFLAPIYIPGNKISNIEMMCFRMVSLPPFPEREWRLSTSAGSKSQLLVTDWTQGKNRWDDPAAAETSFFCLFVCLGDIPSFPLLSVSHL